MQTLCSNRKPKSFFVVLTNKKGVYLKISKSDVCQKKRPDLGLISLTLSDLYTKW